ncbi:hypothetical protein FSP39_011085 [Pinctada imbricata]|uniref:Uncharacterized protein n=1 Tax=Pinctada imbricata TaxID=66713 RepID=A0AA89C5R1_PINIB|nr:hypothetical protein FSP39_011085 [Pinctada imbricata]
MDAKQQMNTTGIQDPKLDEEIQIPENMSRIMDMHLKLIAAERKFRRACAQIIALNHKMDGMVDRYKRAKAENHRSFRYTLRLQLAVVEGVRNMYHDYAQEKAAVVTKLRGELYGGTDDDSEDGMEEMDDGESD